jgi:hypothetical protein
VSLHYPQETARSQWGGARQVRCVADQLAITLSKAGQGGVAYHGQPLFATLLAA